MKDNRVGFGIVGLGQISKTHANALKGQEDCYLVGGFHKNPEKADAWAAEHNCRAFYSLEEMLAEGGENRMVVASESEAFVGDVVRNIGIMLTKGYRMVMYAPSKVRSFETIEGSDFHAAQLHVSTTYYADYTDEKVEEFVKAYRALFRTEPSQFAFQGYDTARFFIERSTRGVDELRGLHMDISLEPLENGNAANKAVRRIVYKKDFTTELKK